MSVDSMFLYIPADGFFKTFQSWKSDEKVKDDLPVFQNLRIKLDELVVAKHFKNA